MGSTAVNCTRLLCAIILHMTIMPEIHCALELMCYCKNHPKVFYGMGNVAPFMVGVMKLTGGLLTEIVNILCINKSEDIPNVVKDYIAFGIISEIDNIMF